MKTFDQIEKLYNTFETTVRHGWIEFYDNADGNDSDNTEQLIDITADLNIDFPDHTLFEEWFAAGHKLYARWISSAIDDDFKSPVIEIVNL